MKLSLLPPEVLTGNLQAWCVWWNVCAVAKLFWNLMKCSFSISSQLWALIVSKHLFMLFLFLFLLVTFEKDFTGWCTRDLRPETGRSPAETGGLPGRSGAAAAGTQTRWSTLQHAVLLRLKKTETHKKTFTFLWPRDASSVLLPWSLCFVVYYCKKFDTIQLHLTAVRHICNNEAVFCIFLKHVCE